MKAFLQVLTILSLSSIVQAQKIVTYDFQTRATSNAEFVRFKTNSIFKINNVNTFIYDVKIEGKNLEFNTDPPGVFKLLFDAEKFAKPDNTPVAIPAALGPPNFIQEVNFYKTALSQLEFTKSLYDNMLLTIYDENLTAPAILANIQALDNVLIFKPGTAPTKISILANCQALLVQQSAIFRRVDQAYQALPAPPSTANTQAWLEIKSLHEKVNNFKYIDLFNSIAQLYTAISNPAAFSVYSSQVLAESDLISYTIEIVPKKDLKGFEAKRSDKFTLGIPIRGGIKIDFSTGLFATFDKNVLDQTYRLDSIPGEGKKIIKNSNRNQFLPSLGAMMHVSLRSTWPIKPAVSLGLGINSTNLENSSYFFGISGIAGEKERIIISLGITGTKRDFLKPQFNENQILPFKTTVDSLSERTFRLGKLISFIAITYNLTNKQQEQ